MNMREWECKACKAKQPYSRERCRHCGNDCPDEVLSQKLSRKHADWLCRHCNVLQFGFNTRCRVCPLGKRGELVNPFQPSITVKITPLERRDANKHVPHHDDDDEDDDSGEDPLLLDDPPPPVPPAPSRATDNRKPLFPVHRRKRNAPPAYTLVEVGVSSGDWVCTYCNELQIAYAKTCRNECGTQRPYGDDVMPLDDVSLCLLCHDRARDSAFLHDKLAHSVACMPCACSYMLENRPCPICQRLISTVVSTI